MISDEVLAVSIARGERDDDWTFDYPLGLGILIAKA